MRIDRKLAMLLACVMLAQGGCVSFRYEDVHITPAPTPATCQAPDPVPIPNMAAQVDPQLEPPPVPLLMSEVDEEIDVAELPQPETAQSKPASPEPIQIDVPSSTSEVARKISGESIPCDGDCLPKHRFALNLWRFYPGWLRWHWQRRTPSEPVLIPPHSKFHPVPTHPVFAQQVIFDEAMPRPLPSKSAKPMPESKTDEPGPADLEADAPMPLDEELRIARPISKPAAVRPIASGWHPLELD